MSGLKKELDIKAGNAVLKGDKETLEQALKEGADVHAVAYGMSLLTWAYMRKSPIELKKCLLKNGATPNLKGGGFWHNMAFSGNITTIKTMLKKFGLKEELQNNKTILEFMFSHFSPNGRATQKTYDLVDLFLSYGANWKTHENRSTVFHEVCKGIGQKKALSFDIWAKMLVSHGVDINFHYQDENITTPPIIHLENTSTMTCLNLGANPTLPHYNKIPAIHLACKFSQFRAIQEMLIKGESFERLDNQGKTPMQYLPHNYATHPEWLLTQSLIEKQSLNQVLSHPSTPIMKTRL